MSLMRTALIALSRNHALQDLIVRVPVSRRMARRFVAGEALDDAIAAVKELDTQGMLATFDHLGENVSNVAAATVAADEYLIALDALNAAEARCNVSVKLTQMGLDLGEEFCYTNVARIVRKAADLGNFVRVDMEGSPYTSRTIAVYRRLRATYDNTGIVIQAYLHRSQADVETLIDEGIGHFRLCKGAYDEPATIAYRERPRVTQALNDLTRTCLEPGARAKGAYAAIASHDEEAIDYARAYAYQHAIPPTAYEFQMLYGIRRELQTALVRQGYQVRIYVPYGMHWYPYFMRRLAERPANLLFFLRALVGD
ncbi:MAG: proline dehydrogenase [Chloroflexi bacterium HGW-Chloroflexi-1]|nr:MAG: proline dehydrogenase [Chloroflexi bacterium HGW-Chloroflexi-1]